MAKKLLLFVLPILTVLLVLAAPVYAVSVTNALYRADVVAINAGDAITSGVAAVCDVNTAALISGEYVTDDLLNTAIQTPGGTDIAYMPGVGANPWVLWFPSIGTETKCYNFYAGGPAMQTGFYYFPDSGGMTTADNDTSLELGNNFQIEQRGYIDTSYAASKYLVYKDGAIETYTSSAGNETSAIANSVSPYSSTSDGYIYATNTAYATAQAAATGTVSAGATTFTIGQAYSSSYPTVAAVNGGNDIVNQTNHTVNLPASISSGDLLLIFFTSDENPTITFPAGWTQLFQTASSTYVKLGAWYRVADGTEGATITVTTSNNQMTCHTSYRITGYSGVPEIGTATTGNSTSPDPPSLTPSWGAANTLWFAVAGKDVGSSGFTPPTNYTDERLDRSDDAANGAGTDSARRSLNAASENPGVFTIASTYWVANTIAVAPPGYRVNRGYVYFPNTIDIPDDASITSATFYFYGQADNSTTDFNISINSGMPTYPTDPLAANDFNKTYYTNGGGSLSTAGFTTVGYNAIPLSATGLTWINKTGTTKFCIRSSRDVSATTPTGAEYVTVYATEQTGTSNDPYLVVNYWYPTVTAACSSDVHTVKTTLSGGTLSIQIDSGTPVTTAFAGSITNNSNNWSFLTNGSMSYLEYQKIWLGGTDPANLKQHIVYERDTVFDDLTTNNNDATPTFRTTSSDPDVTVSFQNFRPIEEATYSGGAGGEETGMLTGTPEEPEEMYGAEEGGGSENIPGAGTINPILEEAGIPADFFWIAAAYGLAAVFVIGSYQFIRSSLLFPAIAGFCVILFFALMTKGDPIPLWTIFPYILNSAGFLVMEKTFGW